MFLRTGGCALLLLCKTAEAIRGARMLPTLPVKVAGPGAMLRLRCVIARGQSICSCSQRRAFGELLGTDAADAAWNYCAPVVDYDALRKEVVTIFADRASEVQGLVVKLQKTQRAAEQALDQYSWPWAGGRVARLRHGAPSTNSLVEAIWRPFSARPVQQICKSTCEPKRP